MASYLIDRPRGAYTCARSDPAGKIVVREFHVDRLVNGFWTLFSQKIDLGKKDHILSVVKVLANEALDKPLDPKFMLVILVYWENDQVQIQSAAVPMPMGRQVLDKVIIGGGPGRTNPSTKDSQWVTKRKPLEIIKNEMKANELILIKEEPNDLLLLEGLTSNFFVLFKDGKTLMTAPPDDILNGTMRRLVMKAAIASAYHVIEEYPKWSERESWLSAFSTSVLRPACPIRELQLYNPTQIDQICMPLSVDDPSLSPLFFAIDEALLESTRT